MFNTRVTEMLGIDYPIIQGGMMNISNPELAAAVSNAGGLGILISARFDTAEQLREEIRKTKSLTDKPFGVNINLFPATRPTPNGAFIDTLIEEGVSVVETSGNRSPEEYMETLKKGNVKVIHKCAGARYAQTAERIGADAVTVVGFENGGATGMYDTTTMLLVPLTVDAVKIPVIAAGGIGDARGFVAALALGAEGVVMGTRFMATQESMAHPKFKDWMLNARETNTMIVQRSIRNTHRVMGNKAAGKVAEMEQRGATLEELLTIIGGERTRKVLLEGDLDAGVASCGQVVGLIHEIPTVKEVIDDIVNGAMESCKRLTGVLSQQAALPR